MLDCRQYLSQSLVLLNLLYILKLIRQFLRYSRRQKLDIHNHKIFPVEVPTEIFLKCKHCCNKTPPPPQASKISHFHAPFLILSSPLLKMTLSSGAAVCLSPFHSQSSTLMVYFPLIFAVESSDLLCRVQKIFLTPFQSHLSLKHERHFPSQGMTMSYKLLWTPGRLWHYSLILELSPFFIKLQAPVPRGRYCLLGN